MIAPGPYNSGPAKMNENSTWISKFNPAAFTAHSGIREAVPIQCQITDSRKFHLKIQVTLWRPNTKKLTVSMCDGATSNVVSSKSILCVLTVSLTTYEWPRAGLGPCIYWARWYFLTHKSRNYDRCSWVYERGTGLARPSNTMGTN